MSVLDSYDLILLRSIIRHRLPHFQVNFQSFPDSIPDSQWSEIRRAVGREYAESGLDHEGSPNNKGLILAELVQRLDLIQSLQAAGTPN